LKLLGRSPNTERFSTPHPLIMIKEMGLVTLTFERLKELQALLGMLQELKS
jgi:hypothetical protein